MRKGEYVIAKSNSPSGEDYQERIEGKAYLVRDTITCEGCSDIAINIGGVTDKSYAQCGCGHMQMSDGKKWTTTECFDYLSKNNVSAAIEYALEEEDYELCVKIRDV